MDLDYFFKISSSSFRFLSLRSFSLIDMPFLLSYQEKFYIIFTLWQSDYKARMVHIKKEKNGNRRYFLCNLYIFFIAYFSFLKSFSLSIKLPSAIWFWMYQKYSFKQKYSRMMALFSTMFTV